MIAFLNQAITGSSWRCTTPDVGGGAYESVATSPTTCSSAFVRGMHKWGSSVMVVLVFLHMGAPFLRRLQYPRELNWVIGVVLLILTMVMSFTGYCCRSTSAPTGPRSSVSTSTAPVR